MGFEKLQQGRTVSGGLGEMGLWGSALEGIAGKSRERRREIYQKN
jgi:hypothetical protein